MFFCFADSSKAEKSNKKANINAAKAKGSSPHKRFLLKLKKINKENAQPLTLKHNKTKMPFNNFFGPRRKTSVPSSKFKIAVSKSTMGLIILNCKKKKQPEWLLKFLQIAF